MYLRVREIFALAGDYDPEQASTVEFFQSIQNKLHFAATGHTAPEIIAARADSSKSNMGLTSWHGSTVRKADCTVAKNYLNQDEIVELNRIVTMWLDFSEDQARRRKQVFLKDWETKLNEFLRFNNRDLLVDRGKSARPPPMPTPKPNTKSLRRAAARCWRRKRKGNRSKRWSRRFGNCHGKYGPESAGIEKAIFRRHGRYSRKPPRETQTNGHRHNPSLSYVASRSQDQA